MVKPLNKIRICIHAVNVHTGGGATLLRSLLTASSDVMITANLDKRMNIGSHNLDEITFFKFASNVHQRLWAEWVLKKKSRNYDIVLCFGNLPPIFKLSCRTITYIQNRYLIDNVTLKILPIKTQLRLRVERLWLKVFARNSDEFIVQTPSMLSACKASGLLGGKNITISPFSTLDNYSENRPIQKNKDKSKNNVFLYVADGEAHKNHEQLIDAWCTLAKEEIFPVLLLTVGKDRYSDLCKLIEQKKQGHHLKIENLGELSHEQVLTKYNEVDALIFPSLFESFGLPLIEAKNEGLPILASELDYVRDLLNPDETFNPYSSLSISRAVKRFMGQGDNDLKILNSDEFLKQILHKKNEE